jgi:hypothetical protein
LNEERGVTSRSESAPATVTTLSVDPGSYVASTARFRCSGGYTRGKALASYLGAFAIAKTSPERGSSTIAVAARARHLARARPRISSTFAWRLASMVRKTSRPGRSRVELTTSMTRPNGSLTIVWRPACPASRPSRPSSIPASPLLSTPA